MSPAMTESKSGNCQDNGKTPKTKNASSEQLDRRGKKFLELKPHLEQQLRMTTLIDTANKEDPKLKEKLKQIIEATQRTLDEAFTALHDCDYDINRAVNKLLEGGGSEWSVLSKKKKPKSSDGNDGREKEKSVENASTETCNEDHTEPKRPFNTRGGNLRGRGFGRGRGGGKIRREPHSSPGRRVFTNSTLETKALDVIETSHLEKTKTPVIRPLDTWDPKRPVSDLLNRGNRNDFEDEEYTGSLSKGLIITSSNFGKKQNIQKSDEKDIALQFLCSQSSVSCGKKNEGEQLSPVKDDIQNKIEEVKSFPLSKIENCESGECASQPTLSRGAPPMSASLTKAPPHSGKPRVRSSSIPASAKQSAANRIPANPVEMPPDKENNVESLDITFGAVDLEDKAFVSLRKSDSSTEVVHCETKSSQLKKSFRNENGSPSVDNLRFVKDLKMDNSFYESHMGQTPYPKTAQRSKSFHGVPLPSKSSSCEITPGISAAYTSNTAVPFSQIPYQNFTTPSTQSLFYQNVLSGQTYTPSSQYGTSGLSSSSFSVPYQSYSSMVQGHKPPSASSSFTADLGGVSSSNINSLSFPAVTSTHNFSIPMTNAESVPKSIPQPTVLGKNVPAMPTLVGPHQVILGQGMTYFQPQLYFQDVPMVQPPRPAPPHVGPGFYDMNYPASPPREGTFPISPSAVLNQVNPDQVTSIVYSDSSSPQYPGFCITPAESNNRSVNNCKPPFHLPVNQLMYSAGKPPSSSALPRSYN